MEGKGFRQHVKTHMFTVPPSVTKMHPKEGSRKLSFGGFWGAFVPTWPRVLPRHQKLHLQDDFPDLRRIYLIVGLIWGACFQRIYAIWVFPLKHIPPSIFIFIPITCAPRDMFSFSVHKPPQGHKHKIPLSIFIFIPITCAPRAMFSFSAH